MKKFQAFKEVPEPTSAPDHLSIVGELRTLADISSLPVSLLKSRFAKNEGRDACPVILFPGYASDERYMKPLAKYLRNLGYQTEGWGLGTNLAGTNFEHRLEDLSEGWDIEPYEGYSAEDYNGEGGVPYLCDLATAQVRKRAEELSTKVSLIGWSLGGYVAREVARDLPDDIAQVITMGAPVIGGPKYTKAAQIFKAKGFDLDWIERETRKRNSTPIQVPITAIFSKSDAIVDWRAAIDKVSQQVEHIQISGSHLGMGFNSTVFKIVRRVLKNRPAKSV